MLQILLVVIATMVILTLFIHQIGITFEKEINWKIYVISNVLVVVCLLGCSYLTTLRLAG